MEKGDDSPKELYGIRGLAEGEYDPRIPVSWTDCPPIKLDGSVPGMEAMRFQYMNLARYALRMSGRWHSARQKQQAMEAAYSKERKQRRQIQAEVLELRTRVEELEKGETQLKKWEARKPLINHYLGAVGEMARDIEVMRSQLSQLGYEVSERSYTFEPDKISKPRVAAPDRRDADQHPGKSFSSSSTAVPGEHDNSSSSRKRKLAEYAADVPQNNGYELRPRRSSRDLMPPPLPKLKAPQREALHVVQPMTSQDMRRPPSSRQSAHAFQDPSQRPQQLEYRDSHYTSSEQEALPFRASRSHAAPSPDNNKGGSAYHDASNERRRAQASAWNRNAHPVQPLAQLSIGSPQRQQAPFHRSLKSRSAIPQPIQHTSRRPGSRVTEYDVDYGTVAQQQDYQARQPLQPLSASYLNHQVAVPSRSRNAHATPSPQRQSQPPAASVVSPFFKRGATSWPPPTTQCPPTRGSYVQPHYASLSRETATGYSRAPSQLEPPDDYSQQPSLNGLSFIERPHRPVDHQPLYQSPSQRPVAGGRLSRASRIPQTPRNSQGLFQRPDRAPFPTATTYALSRPQSIANSGRISFQPNQQPTSLARNQEQALSQIRGVRGLSSQGARPRNYDSGPLYDPIRTLYSSAGGRRSVRR
ncbi:hypothetical protein LTR85_006914 [Meristemomyces frigidus]|nr:hypothetical protein LTR85_006914 [Meristemomyces frigidus]